MNWNQLTMKKNVITIILILLPFLLFSQEQKRKVTAEELLNMGESQAFNTIAKLNKTDAAELITQIRGTAKKEYPNIDKFYLLISHLENIKAIEEEQTRLKSLNLVYGLGLMLILGLLGYILYSQRKTIQNLSQLLK